MAEEIAKHGVKEPNEGVNGKLASNMTGEAIEGVFDYGNITEDHKAVVKEIIEFLRQREGVPTQMMIEELKVKFEIVEIPMKSIEDSIWGQLIKDERLGVSIQGFRTTKDSDGKQLKIPHVGMSADLDYLDEFVNRLANKIKNINEVKED